MREYIKRCIQKAIENESNEIQKKHWDVEFGYDCIGIRFNKNDIDLSTDLIDDLKRKLETQLSWIRITQSGNFMLCFNISNLILKEYENWETYNKIYDGFGDFMKRFVIALNKKEVSVLDTEGYNAELFSMELVSEEDAKWMKIELDTLVSALNEQDRIMKEHNLHFP